jgi:hypothetical protein
MSKIEDALKISEEILEDIENDRLPFVQVINKCKKLARLRDDFDALKWFSLEMSGYGRDLVLPGVSDTDRSKYADISGRSTLSVDPETKEPLKKHWTPSISDLEVEVRSSEAVLEKLKPPENFVPSVSKSSYTSSFSGPTSNERVLEKYSDVLKAITIKERSVMKNLKMYKSILSKIQNSIYNYVFGIYYQLRFENVTETIFQETKMTVDKELSKICPEVIKKFVAAYERLNSDNPEEWSQAMSSCRNILKEFADYVFPAEKEYVMKNGSSIVVTEDKYKNRLIAFIDQNSKGDLNKFLSSRASDLESRIHILNDLLSRGTHSGMGLLDVKICVIDTYFLIGSLMGLKKG